MAPGKRITAPTRQAGMITSAIIPRPLRAAPMAVEFSASRASRPLGWLSYFRGWRLGSALGGQSILSSSSSSRSRSACRGCVRIDNKSIAFSEITIISADSGQALGFVSKGARRARGAVRLQPSEFMKPAIVPLFWHEFGTRPAGEIRRWRADLAERRSLLGVPPCLILVQPDVALVGHYLLRKWLLMFLAGLPVWLFVAPAALGAVVAPIVYHLDARLSGAASGSTSSSIRKAIPARVGYHIAQSRLRSDPPFGKGFLARRPEPPRLSFRRSHRFRLQRE